MADKIVSWGGIDSKGTSGMGVTGSLAVSGSITANNTITFFGRSAQNAPGSIANDSSDNLIIAANQGSGKGTYLGPQNGTSVVTNASNINFYTGNGVATHQMVVGYGSSNSIGNVGIGTSAPSATLHVKGTGTTSSTTALLVQNANASASLSVKDDGTNAIVSSNENPFTVSHTNGSSKLAFVLGNGSAIASGFAALRLNDSVNVFTFGGSRTITAYPLTVGQPTETFYIRGGGGGSDVASPSVALTDNTYNAGGYTVTSGTQTTVQIGGIGAPSNSIWKPASGTANYTLLAVAPNMSGSGTYSGTIRGIYYAPTVTSTTYGAHRAIETTAGDIVFSGGYVGIGTSTTYGLQVANTSSLLVSATGIIAGYSTGSAAISITPHIYATAGNRTYYSMYIGNPGITTSGSFGSYDFKSLVTAGGAVFNGGILAGDSRFYATSNAVSFQGYNPYNGQTGTAAGGITFTARQVEGSDEAGIGAYYGNGSRLYIYNKYNASDSKIIFSVGGTIRSSFFGTGNLSIGNGETDMSARLGVKGSGTTSSTTSLLVQNANASASLQVKDDGSTTIANGLTVTSGSATVNAGSSNNFFVADTGAGTYGGLSLKNSTQDYNGLIYTGRSGASNLILFQHTTYSGSPTAAGSQAFGATSTRFGVANNTAYGHTVTINKPDGTGGTPNYPLVLTNFKNTTNTSVGLLLQTGTPNEVSVLDGGSIVMFKTNLTEPYVTTNLRFYTISDGANTLSEKMRISNSGSLLVGTTTDSGYKLNVSGSGNFTDSLTVTGSLILSGSNVSTAWTSYTPTWEGQVSNPSLGDGSITGAYKVIGKTCFVRIKLNYGSTTSGGSGAWWFGLPFTGSNADGIQMACSMLDNGNAWYQGIANGTYAGYAHKTAIIAQSPGSNSSQGVDLGFPFVWGNTDSLQFAGSYEIA